MKRYNWRPLVVVAALIVAWQLALGGGKLVSDTLAPPGPVAVSLFHMLRDGSVLQASFDTLSAALLGLALGAGIGTALGLAGGILSPVGTAIRGPVEVLRPLPAIALVPLMTIIFGLGLEMEVYVVAFAVVWPSIILTQTAVRNVEKRLLEVADVLELSYFARIRKIVLPAILPRLVVMLRFTAAIALLMAVTVELVSNPWGLGHEMMVASQDMAPARMIAFLFVVTAIGWCLNWALVAAERRLLPGAR